MDNKQLMTKLLEKLSENQKQKVYDFTSSAYRRQDQEKEQNE